MKVYQVIIQYLEPIDAAVTLHAESEEDAINIIRRQWAENNIDVTIVNIEELADLPNAGPEDFDLNRKVN